MKIYIAGKYSSDNIIQALKNIREGIKVGAKLIKMGHSPFCPWLDHQFFFYEDITLEEIRNYSLTWLSSCDTMLVLPNSENSKGTQQEVIEATKLGIKIIYNIEDIQ
jgi:hypothetical protein